MAKADSIVLPGVTAMAHSADESCANCSLRDGCSLRRATWFGCWTTRPLPD
jgi:hypothetical protein